MSKYTKILVYLDNCLASDIASDSRSERREKTIKFWDKVTDAHGKYKGVISEYVLAESRKGKKSKRKEKREGLYAKLRVLPASLKCVKLASDLRESLEWGSDRMMDALHIAVSSIYEVPFVVTWDRGMLGENEKDVHFYLAERGLYAPAILTPEDFLTRANPPRRGSRGYNTTGVKEFRAIRRSLGRQSGGSMTKLLRILGIK